MNTITLIGFLATDPVEKEAKNGNKYMTLRIATRIRKEDNPIWWSVNVFSSTLDRMQNMIPYIKKGSHLLIHGSISECNAYLNRDQEPSANISIIANDIKFVPSKKVTEPESN
jgi:single-stranded DNA-binding protein